MAVVVKLTYRGEVLSKMPWRTVRFCFTPRNTGKLYCKKFNNIDHIVISDCFVCKINNVVYHNNKIKH